MCEAERDGERWGRERRGRGRLERRKKGRNGHYKGSRNFLRYDTQRWLMLTNNTWNDKEVCRQEGREGRKVFICYCLVTKLVVVVVVVVISECHLCH